MSLQSITAAAARVIAGVPGVRASYVAEPIDVVGQPDAQRTPGLISDTPVVITSYENFELTAGSPEHIAHILRADIWVHGRSTSEAERAFLPIATGIVAAMRSKVGLYGEATLAKVIRGGPPRAEEIGDPNPQPFVIFPVYVRVQELTVQNYTLE
jgi:hypothetical protein